MTHLSPNTREVLVFVIEHGPIKTSDLAKLLKHRAIQSLQLSLQYLRKLDLLEYKDMKWQATFRSKLMETK